MANCSSSALQAVHYSRQTTKNGTPALTSESMYRNPLSVPSWHTRDYNSTETIPTFLEGFSLSSNRCWRALTGNATFKQSGRTVTVHSDLHTARTIERTSESRQSIANSICFPSNGFTYFLTLFSKFFSSFPHGTCSLSVSWQYLALDGVYHPFWAAFPSNPTHRKRIVDGQPHLIRDCHPLWCAVPSNLGEIDPAWKRFSRLQFAVASNRDFKLELFPLHSPLLGESLLVSFPPLINMLKFSG